MSEHHEQIHHTETIFNGKIVHLQVHHVTLPDGQRALRELIQHPGAVGIVPIDDAGHVYLVEQYRIGAGRALLEIPAGLREPEEAPEITANRELREEIGHHANKLHSLGGTYMAPGYTTEYVHLYLAEDLQASPLPQDADEFLTVRYLPLSQALALVDDGTIVDSKSIIGLLRVARHYGL